MIRPCCTEWLLSLTEPEEQKTERPGDDRGRDALRLMMARRG